MSMMEVPIYELYIYCNKSDYVLQIFVHLDCPGDGGVSNNCVYAEMSKLDPHLRRDDVNTVLDALKSDTTVVDFDEFLYAIAQIGAVYRKEL